MARISTYSFWLEMVKSCGKDAAIAGEPASSCPWTYAVEREAWLNGHRIGLARRKTISGG